MRICLQVTSMFESIAFSLCATQCQEGSCETSDPYIRRNAQRVLSSIDLDTDKTLFNLRMSNSISGSIAILFFPITSWSLRKSG